MMRIKILILSRFGSLLYMRAYLTAVMKASRDIVYKIKLFVVPIALIKKLIDGFLIENNWFTNLLDSFLFIVSVLLIFSRIYCKS